MATSDSTSSRSHRKPYPDFPLTPRNDGRWQKRIRGRCYYFSGSWQEALAEFKRQLPYLETGQSPPDEHGPECFTLNKLFNADDGFLRAKEILVESGELTRSSFSDYKRTCRKLIEAFGRERVVSSLTPADFTKLRESFAATMGPVGIANEIGRTRVIFKFAHDQGLIDQPVKYGQTFKKPSAKVLRVNRATRDKTLTSEQIRQLIGEASPQLKGMILLGINAGLGNSDCGQLCKSHIQGDWIWYPRPKTGVERKAKLWPETVQAIGAVARDENELVFVTKYGRSWHKDASDNPISAEFRKLLSSNRMYQRGRGFYSLRHTFATEARNARDDEAVRVIMGHADESVLDEHYTRNFPELRLEAIAQHVYDWLFVNRYT